MLSLPRKDFQFWISTAKTKVRDHTLWPTFTGTLQRLFGRAAAVQVRNRHFAPLRGFLPGAGGREDLSRGLRHQERLAPLRGQGGGEGAQRVGGRLHCRGRVGILARLSEPSSQGPPCSPQRRRVTEPPDAAERRVQLVDPTLGLAQSHESLPQDEARGQLVLGPPDLARLVDGFLGQPGRFGMFPFRQGDLCSGLGKAPGHEPLVRSLGVLSSVPQLGPSSLGPANLAASQVCEQLVDPGLEDRVGEAGCRTELRGFLVAQGCFVELEQVAVQLAGHVERASRHSGHQPELTSAGDDLSNLGRASSCRPIPVRVSAWTDPVRSNESELLISSAKEMACSPYSRARSYSPVQYQPVAIWSRHSARSARRVPGVHFAKARAPSSRDVSMLPSMLEARLCSASAGPMNSSMDRDWARSNASCDIRVAPAASMAQCAVWARAISTFRRCRPSVSSRSLSRAAAAPRSPSSTCVSARRMAMARRSSGWSSGTSSRAWPNRATASSLAHPLAACSAASWRNRMAWSTSPASCQWWASSAAASSIRSPAADSMNRATAACRSLRAARGSVA